MLSPHSQELMPHGVGSHLPLNELPLGTVKEPRNFPPGKALRC